MNKKGEIFLITSSRQVEHGQVLKVGTDVEHARWQLQKAKTRHSKMHVWIHKETYTHTSVVRDACLSALRHEAQ